MKKISSIALLITITLILFLIILMPHVIAITGSLGFARMVLKAEVGDTIEKYILVRNVNSFPVNIELSVSGDLEKDIYIGDNNFTLAPSEEKKVYFTIEVKEEGTTESKINVKFISPNGESIGLSSTIIVIAGQSVSNVSDDFVSISEIKIKGINISENSEINFSKGEIVPIEVKFKANKDSENVKLNTYIEGHSEKISSSILEFNITQGDDYDKILSLNIPENILTDNYPLFIRFSAPNEDFQEITIDVDINGIIPLEVNDIDKNPPLIELISPKDNYKKRTTKSSYRIDFQYKVSDESEITNCYLIIDNGIEGIMEKVEKNVEIKFSLELDNGNYDWMIECTDFYGNEGSSEIRELNIQHKEKSSDEYLENTDYYIPIKDLEENNGVSEIAIKNKMIDLEESKFNLKNSEIYSDDLMDNSSIGNLFLIFLISVILLFVIIIFVIIFRI